MNSSADIIKPLPRAEDDQVLSTSSVKRGETLLEALAGFDEDFIQALEEDRAEQPLVESANPRGISEQQVGDGV